jgi:hypothetical protein
MALQYPALFLLGKIMERFTKISAYCAEHFLSPDSRYFGIHTMWYLQSQLL